MLVVSSGRFFFCILIDIHAVPIPHLFSYDQ
jgi:hypothetical protein